MASASIATVSSILKEVYPGMIEDELNNECALWAILEKSKDQVEGEGRAVIRPMRVTRNNGIGARVENDTLPTPGAQGYQRATINMTSNYLRGQISNRVMRSANGGDAAFADVLEEEIKFGLSDFVSDVTRQLYAGAGIIAKVNGAVTASTSIVVTDVTAFVVGMSVEFWNGSTNQTTNDAGLLGTAIVSINTATSTLVVATAQTIATSATVARQGNNTGATATKELQGLDTIVDDGTDYPGFSYFGISRTTYPILNGNRLDISSSTAVPGDSTVILSENKMQYAVDQARRIGGGYVDLFVTDYNTRRKYSNLLQSNKRYPVEGINGPQFAGGFERSKDLRTNMAEGLSFDGAPVIASRLNPAGKMWGLDTSSMKIFQQSDVEWVLNGDSVLHPLMAATGQDAYQYSLFYDAQLYCEAPNRNAKMVNC